MKKIKFCAFILIAAMLMLMQVFAAEFGLKAEMQDGNVTLSWNGSESEIYYILRDGNYITEVVGSEYTDNDMEINTAYEYSVMSSESGDVESITVALRDDYYSEKMMLFTSEVQSGFKAIDTENYSESGVSDTYKLFGKVSLRWRFKGKQAGKRKEMYISDGADKKSFDVRPIKDYGVFGFWIYTDAANYKDDLKVFLIDEYGNMTKYCTVSAKANRWKFISIDFAELENGNFNFGKIVSANLIKTNAETEQFDIYIQNIGFYGVNDGILAFSAEKISENSVKLEFTKEINGDTLAADAFECDNGLEISDCTANEDLKGCVLTFDKPVINGEIYKITANSKLEGKNGEKVGSKSNFATFGEKYYNGKITFSEETTAFAAGAAVFYNGNTSAIVRGLRMNNCETSYISDGKAYVPKKLVNMAFGLDYEENGCISADTVCSDSGLQLYIRGNLIVIAKEKPSGNAADELQKALSYEWGNVHLGTEGFVTGIISHPKDSELMYARTDVGGAYRYDKNAKKWIPMLDLIPHGDTWLMGVSGMAADPNDTDTVYAACGMYDYVYPHDILKSTDGGNTWKRLYFNKYTLSEGDHRYSGENIAVDPKNSDTVYIGTYKDGLWKSTDGGTSWKNISDIPKGETTPGGGVRILYFDESGTLYAAVCGDGVYKSTDGESFVKLGESPKVPIRITSDNGVLYVSASSRRTANTGGLYKYDGSTWTDISPEFLRNKTEHSVGAFVVNGSFIFAAGAPYTDNLGYFVRSYDGGQTWENCGFARGENNIWSNPSSMIWANDEKTDVILATGAGIHKMENVASGTLYPKYFEDGAEELVCFDVMSVPSEESPMYQVGCMDKGYVKGYNLTERGTSHENWALEACSLDFCEEEPKYEVQAGHDENSNGVAMYSEDFGKTWTKKAWNGGIIHDFAVSAKVGENGYPVILAAAATGILKSTDFGETWETVNTDIVSDTSKNMGKEYLKSDRVNADVFYYSESGKLYVTKDSGATWEYLRSFNVPSDMAANKDNAMVRNYFATIPYVEGGIWFNTLDGIYTSDDFGETWKLAQGIENTKTFGFGKGKSALPAAYAVGEVNSVYGIYISDNLGESWQRIDGGFNIPCTMYQMTGDRRQYGRVFIATGGRGVFCGSILPESIGETELTAEKDVLSWDTVDGAGKYAILRNGEKIAETASCTYTDMSADKDNVYEYEVSAMSGEMVIARSNTVWIYYDDSSKHEAISIYKNQTRNINNLYIENQVWGEPQYSAEHTIIGGTAVKWNMRAGDGNRIYFKTQQLNTEGNRELRPYDISGIKETGYLSMLVYPKSELSDFAGAINLALYSGPENSSAKQSRIISIKDQLKMNKWNLVKVPVADFKNDDIDLTAVSRILFQSLGAYAADSVTYYIQNVRFCDETDINITSAEYDGRNITISWSTKNIFGGKYTVECNGTKAAETDGTSCTFAQEAKGKIYEYTVSAADSSGNVIKKSTICSRFFEDENKVSKITLLGNSKPSESDVTVSVLPNWGSYNGNGEYAILGGKSALISVKSRKTISAAPSYWTKDNGLKLEFKENKDISEFTENGYLRMLVYTKTDIEKFPGEIKVVLYSGTDSESKESNAKVVTDKIAMNKWSAVEIPVADMIKTGLDISKISQLQFIATGDYENDGECEFYIQGIEFHREKGLFTDGINCEITGNTAKISAKIYNFTDFDVSPIIIAAAYNEDGSLAKVEKFGGAAVAKGKNDTLNVTFTAPEGKNIKAMLIESIDNMRPISQR